MGEKISPEMLNTIFTLMANFSSEEQSKIEEIREEYRKEIEVLNKRNALMLSIVRGLTAIIIISVIVFGFICNNAINKHFELDRMQAEEIVVDFETVIEKETDKDTLGGNIQTGDNASINVGSSNRISRYGGGDS